MIVVSSLYETEPYPPLPPQGAFYNAVVEVETQRTPIGLLKYCQAIEHRLGRVRTVPKGPRTIDLDILAYEGCIVDEAGFALPHVGLAHRPFVLVPLDEIAPDFLHPVMQLTPREMLAKLRDFPPSVSKQFGPDWVWGR